MTNERNTAPGENPKWPELEARMVSADAEATPATTKPPQADEEQWHIAERSAKADKVVGNLFAKLGVDRKVEASATAVAGEFPPSGSGETTVHGGKRHELDLDLGGGGNTPPPPQPPSGGGGAGSAGTSEPSWFDKLLAFMQSTTGKIFGVTIIVYIAISWISATITDPKRLAVMKELSEMGAKQKELELKEKELDARLQGNSSATTTMQASGCTAHNGNATAQMLSSCKTLTDITSEHGKARGVRYTIQGNLDRVNGDYELRDPKDPSHVLCQTNLPGSYRYSANGCADELRTLSYPADLLFARYSNITYIFR
ncbi:MAG: hypothetical protein QG653_501 [Patescibacteria group bacterium]|nr:hypothetical protein [Patescibacteria group bacterium]